jgi:hypothetical protein
MIQFEESQVRHKEEENCYPGIRQTSDEIALPSAAFFALRDCSDQDIMEWSGVRIIQKSIIIWIQENIFILNVIGGSNVDFITASPESLYERRQSGVLQQQAG